MQLAAPGTARLHKQPLQHSRPPQTHCSARAQTCRVPGCQDQSRPAPAGHCTPPSAPRCHPAIQLPACHSSAGAATPAPPHLSTATLAQVYTLYTCTVLLLTAAKYWPPLLKQQSRQPLMGNSLTSLQDVRRSQSPCVARRVEQTRRHGLGESGSRLESFSGLLVGPWMGRHQSSSVPNAIQGCLFNASRHQSLSAVQGAACAEHAACYHTPDQPSLTTSPPSWSVAAGPSCPT